MTCQQAIKQLDESLERQASDAVCSNPGGDVCPKAKGEDNNTHNHNPTHFFSHKAPNHRSPGPNNYSHQESPIHPPPHCHG